MSRLLGLSVLGLAVAAAPAFAQPTPYPAADRYGPAPAATPPMAYGYGQADTTGAASPPTRVLSWPGKVALRPPPVPAAPMSAPPTGPAYASRYHAPDEPGRRAWSTADAAPQAWRPRPSGQSFTPPVQGPYAAPAAQAYGRYAASGYGTRTYGPTAPNPAADAQTARANAQGWRPVFGQPAVPVPRAPAPTSIYATPNQSYPTPFAAARAAPPNRAFAADRRYGYDPTLDHAVRFYSVSRPFGLKPDPAPIPPQFFTATADLGADPPGPLPVNHTTAATRAAVVGGDSGGQ